MLTFNLPKLKVATRLSILATFIAFTIPTIVITPSTNKAIAQDQLNQLDKRYIDNPNYYTNTKKKKTIEPKSSKDFGSLKKVEIYADPASRENSLYITRVTKELQKYDPKILSEYDNTKHSQQYLNKIDYPYLLALGGDKFVEEVLIWMRKNNLLITSAYQNKKPWKLYNFISNKIYMSKIRQDLKQDITKASYSTVYELLNYIIMHKQVSSNERSELKNYFSELLRFNF